jgi:fructokinase
MKKVFCAGTIVVDIITEAIKTPVTPNSGHKVSISSNAGGNALNVAVNLTNLSLSGRQIICCGAIGNDPEANFLKNTLFKNKIIDKTIRSNSTTGKAIFITHSSGERSYIVDTGASAHFKTSHLLSTLKTEKPFIFYIGESPASPDIDQNLSNILETSKKMGCINILDYIVTSNEHSGSLFECAANTDILHINEYEAKVLTGTANIAEAASFLREKGFKRVFVSEGEKGFVLAQKHGLKRFQSFSVDCVDSTGAGDAFCSGLIYSLLKVDKIPEDLSAIATFASACGACAVTKPGCTEGLSLTKAQALITQ